MQQTKQVSKNKKQKAFKQSLDSPFIFKWPEIPKDLHDRILDSLCSILTPIGQARAERDYLRASKKRKSKDVPIIAQEQQMSSTNEENLHTLKDLYIGMNHVTCELEKSVRSGKTDIDIVFVCRGDIEAMHVYSHLPSLICLAGKQCPIRLVPLHKGAMERIALALGLKHVYTIAIKMGSTAFEKIVSDIKDEIPPPIIPSWLSTYTPPVVCKVPMNIREKRKQVPE